MTQYMIPDRIRTAIEDEREYQIEKWGCDNHEVGAWLTIMQVKLREAAGGWCSGHGHYKGLHGIKQVVAVGVACLEQHGVIMREYLETLTGACEDD